MTNPEIKVKGWKAIPVVLAIVGYKYYAMRSTLDTEATQAIKFWLLSEYAGKSYRKHLGAGVIGLSHLLFFNCRPGYGIFR